MKQRVRFIVNPISGSGKNAAFPELIKKYIDNYRFEYDIVFTQHRNHGREIALKSAQENIDIVVAVGGDGSVHEVGTALIGSKTKLAIIPTGSGNGYARHLGIPLKIEDALRVLNRNLVVKVDTILANDKPFLNAGGYGFDAWIAKKFDEYGTRGFRSYAKLVAKELRRYKPIRVEIETNGKIYKRALLMCTVANGTEFGNGLKVSPESSLVDGKAELILIKPFPVWIAPVVFIKFFRKKGHRSKYNEIIQFSKARIKLTRIIAHYDGEPFDVRKEINLEVLPKSLNILAGKLDV